MLSFTKLVKIAQFQGFVKKTIYRNVPKYWGKARPEPILKLFCFGYISGAIGTFTQTIIINSGHVQEEYHDIHPDWQTSVPFLFIIIRI